MKHFELNIDGLVGPSHNYAGLSLGNLASAQNNLKTAHPKQAALQGLQKIRLLLTRGYAQAFMPPQARPHFHFLREIGFSGNDKSILIKAIDQMPEILPTIYSASNMWAANTATVTSSLESNDQSVHFTPANLHTTLHRSFEHSASFLFLKTAFSNESFFQVHRSLAQHTSFADEGAANHMRLCDDFDTKGVNVFVYGRSEQNPTQKFPARQSLRASQCIARQHECEENSIFIQQNPIAIDAGAFHNDVVAVSNGPVLLFHEFAFVKEQEKNAFEEIKKHVANFTPICIYNDEISLDEAIQSYLFNCQLLADPNVGNEKMHILAPKECEDSSAVKQCIERIIQDDSNPISQVTYVDVKQSMQNGGGPACLRLRVPLSEEAFQAMDSRFILNEEKCARLETWIEKHYREALSPSDLRDPQLADECLTALDDLTSVMGLGSYYEFQQ